MPTRNVNLTDELDRFVLAEVESGRFEDASEVVRAALRTLEREEQQHEAKLAALEGSASRAEWSPVYTACCLAMVIKATLTEVYGSMPSLPWIL
jgi:antitoxin ParD1/3/4